MSRDLRRIKVQLLKALRGLSTNKNHPLHDDIAAAKADRKIMEESPYMASKSPGPRAKLLRELDLAVDSREAKLKRMLADKAKAKTGLGVAGAATVAGAGLPASAIAMHKSESEAPADIGFKLAQWATGFMEKCAEYGVDGETIIEGELTKIAGGRDRLAMEGLKRIFQNAGRKQFNRGPVAGQAKSLFNESARGGSKYPEFKGKQDLKLDRPEPGAGLKRLPMPEPKPVQAEGLWPNKPLEAPKPIAASLWPEKSIAEPKPEPRKRLTPLERPKKPEPEKLKPEMEVKQPENVEPTYKEEPTPEPTPKANKGPGLKENLRNWFGGAATSAGNMGKATGRGLLTGAKATAGIGLLGAGGIGLSNAYDSMNKNNMGMAALAAQQAKKDQADAEKRMNRGPLLPYMENTHYIRDSLEANRQQAKANNNAIRLSPSYLDLPGAQPFGATPGLLKANSARRIMLPGLDEAIERVKMAQVIQNSNYMQAGGGQQPKPYSTTAKESPGSGWMGGITDAMSSSVKALGSGLAAGGKAVAGIPSAIGNGVVKATTAMGVGPSNNYTQAELTAPYHDRKAYQAGVQGTGSYPTPAGGPNSDKITLPKGAVSADNMTPDVKAKNDAFHEQENKRIQAETAARLATDGAARRLPQQQKEEAQVAYDNKVNAPQGPRPIVNYQQPVSAPGREPAPRPQVANQPVQNAGSGAPVKMQTTPGKVSNQADFDQKNVNMTAGRQNVARGNGAITSNGQPLQSNVDVIDHAGLKRQQQRNSEADRQFAQATSHIDMNNQNQQPRIQVAKGSLPKPAPVKSVVSQIRVGKNGV